MKTIKASPYILKEKKDIFRLENSSCCVANIHELVFPKKIYIGLLKNAYKILSSFFEVISILSVLGILSHPGLLDVYFKTQTVQAPG